MSGEAEALDRPLRLVAMEDALAMLELLPLDTAHPLAYALANAIRHLPHVYADERQSQLLAGTHRDVRYRRSVVDAHLLELRLDMLRTKIAELAPQIGFLETSEGWVPVVGSDQLRPLRSWRLE